MFGGKIGVPELLIILVIVLVFFGGRRIPEVMRGLGEGIRSFREGMHGEGPSSSGSSSNAPSNPSAGQSSQDKK